MKYRLDRRVKLNEVSEFKNLYTWSLQEFDEDGKQLGQNQVPWFWSLYFDCTELNYDFLITMKQDSPPSEDDASQIGAYQANDREVIRGMLRPQSRYREMGQYSMFGTSRAIEAFHLFIYRLEEGEKEHCRLTGSVGYESDWDFESADRPDYVSVSILLCCEKFDKITNLIKGGTPNNILVRLQGVMGFYSNWSPSIRTDRVKILANIKDQKIEISENCNIAPHTLGQVSELEISFGHKSELIAVTSPDENSIESSDEFYANADQEKEVRIGTTGAALDLEKLLVRLLIPLWGILAVLTFQLFR